MNRWCSESPLRSSLPICHSQFKRFVSRRSMGAGWGERTPKPLLFKTIPQLVVRDGRGLSTKTSKASRENLKSAEERGGLFAQEATQGRILTLDRQKMRGVLGNRYYMCKREESMGDIPQIASQQEYCGSQSSMFGIEWVIHSATRLMLLSWNGFYDEKRKKDSQVGCSFVLNNLLGEIRGHQKTQKNQEQVFQFVYV